jgi:hypothetical protein
MVQLAAVAVVVKQQVEVLGCSGCAERVGHPLRIQSAFVAEDAVIEIFFINM